MAEYTRKGSENLRKMFGWHTTSMDEIRQFATYESAMHANYDATTHPNCSGRCKFTTQSVIQNSADKIAYTMPNWSSNVRCNKINNFRQSS